MVSAASNLSWSYEVYGILFHHVLSEKWHKKSRKPFKDFLLGGAVGGRLVFSFESSGLFLKSELT